MLKDNDPLLLRLQSLDRQITGIRQLAIQYADPPEAAANLFGVLLPVLHEHAAVSLKMLERVAGAERGRAHGSI